MVVYPPAKKRPQGLRVICVKWGDKYPSDYVYKLQNMCARHLPAHEFICITETPVEGVSCNPLLCDLPGWWQKLGLFQPGLFPGNNIYLDLDVVITSSLSAFVGALATDPTKLWTLDDFSYSLRSPKSVSGETARQLGGAGTINSSVMLWQGSPESEVYQIWEDFNPEVMDVLHGDQNFITQSLYPYSIKFLPDGYVQSYKYGGRKQAPLVVFHGEPKPHQVGDDWVKQHWV